VKWVVGVSCYLDVWTDEIFLGFTVLYQPGCFHVAKCWIGVRTRCTKRTEDGDKLRLRIACRLLVSAAANATGKSLKSDFGSAIPAENGQVSAVDLAMSRVNSTHTRLGVEGALAMPGLS
jgi:hypothetical protein